MNSTVKHIAIACTFVAMSDTKRYAIAIHGGAGTILKSSMTPKLEKAYQQILEKAIQRGYKLLEKKASALDAVETAVKLLEDAPLFNAGRGSVFTANGKHEMDASIMDGKTLDAGAVALLQKIKNPVELARMVMEHSGHVFLAGKGAEDFASKMGLKKMEASYFYTEARYKQLQLAKKADKVLMDHTDRKFGTVGAVALDQFGNLAAATSTGGMTNKKFGRIGDSPMIGCGTYANNNSCAVSCTGSGEYFIRVNAAFHVSALMQYKKYSLEKACREVVDHLLPSIGGDGGLIAIDHSGKISMCFNTEGMYRACKSNVGDYSIGIYK